MQDCLMVSKTDPVIRKIIQSTYPDYKGRKVKLAAQKYPINMRSYWSGGSRSFFVLLNLNNFSQTAIPQQSAFDRPVAGIDAYELIDCMICVEHVIFCGKDLGLRIWCTPAMFEELSKAKPVGA